MDADYKEPVHSSLKNYSSVGHIFTVNLGSAFCYYLYKKAGFFEEFHQQ